MNYSKKIQDLISILEKTRIEQTLKIDRNMPKEKIRQIRNTNKAIEKAKPILLKLKKYFEKLENKFSKFNLSDEEKKDKLIKRYDEIKSLFIKDLFNIIKLIGYDASTIIISSIISIIFLIVAVPGGLIAAIPTFLMLKKLKEGKEKIYNKKILKDLEKAEEKLKKTIAKR